MTTPNIDTKVLRELEAKATKGPWVWGTMYSGPEDEYGVGTFGPIDVLAFKSTGYDGNPILATEAVSENGDRFHVIAAGCGEYTPYDNPHDAVLIAALRNAAPALLDLAERAQEQAKECASNLRSLRASQEECYSLYEERDALKAEVERLTLQIKLMADAMKD